ncbi:hypothetical protein BO94DRAFT_592378 [Aspergillus sclerotioniger CBS 115572]|uniref:Uncharacterized protein n=1 Tax=Aspergillus sclerotioniger CBS 115572 TaxID=1450535 RepID=A0A317XEB8_9EURO|nr:hypothetical protein BO94DRAFT_592378 [Aspergillus sclerotioniger CBS 115572]PWY96531.1 hypothetical protein BO94DRAFT_592378 [Aspergillus sclerotioniger CBS 115572]
MAMILSLRQIQSIQTTTIYFHSITTITLPTLTNNIQQSLNQNEPPPPSHSPLLTILPLTTAHPTDPITAALNTAHDITSPTLQNIPIPIPIPPHSPLPVVCSPTGANYCNLGIATYAPSGSVKIREMYVYDRSCRGLGTTPFNFDKGHLSVQSLLPWTVEVDFTGGGNKPEGYFWYAGRKTDLGRNLKRSYETGESSTSGMAPS